MACTLTVVFNTPGYNNGTDTANYSVVDGSYRSPYIQNRTDLGYNGTTNNVYSVLCSGSSGVITLGTYYPGSIKVSIRSSTNSCAPASSLYDCLNGVCVVATQYNTSGVYNNLADCQAVCANGGSCGQGKVCVDPNNYCAPGKVCIDQTEMTQINGIISTLSGKFC